MKIWHISDSHQLHHQLVPPSNVDVVVHSGDAANKNDPFINEHELRNFLEWFAALPVKTKIFVPGNHDISLERNLVLTREIESLGVIPLIDAGVTIDGVNFWGSPWVPRYGNWSWMTSRETLNRKWEKIPQSTDVLITHGPPFAILDSTYGNSHEYENVGCRALQKRIFRDPPLLHLFGHVHSVKDIRNSGTRTVGGCCTVFSNGSVCDDDIKDSVTTNGNVVEVVPR